MFAIGPAKIAFIPFAALRHPEMAIAASKQGCDLIISDAEQFSTEVRLLAGARTINHLAVAICTDNGGGIWMRPEGHRRWQEELTGRAGLCSFVLSTALTRKKRFQDRIDFERLLQKQDSW